MQSFRINEEKFPELLEPGVFQVFLLTSPIPYPFSFAVHAWFVTHHNGELHRYEFGKFRGSPYPKGIGLLKDFFKSTIGMNRLPGNGKWRFGSKVIGMVSGQDGSKAAHLYRFLRDKSDHYPHRHRYSYLGPNSNTYVGWVLRHFPEAGLSLPATAIGKDYFAQLVTFTNKMKTRLVDVKRGLAGG